MCVYVFVCVCVRKPPRQLHIVEQANTESSEGAKFDRREPREKENSTWWRTSRPCRFFKQRTGRDNGVPTDGTRDTTRRNRERPPHGPHSDGSHEVGQRTFHGVHPGPEITHLKCDIWTFLFEPPRLFELFVGATRPNQSNVREWMKTQSLCATCVVAERERRRRPN